MPTSLYMPSVVVEIAFNAGYTTPAASRTWTDVTDYVELSEGIDITYGRQDERSTADANQCSLTLDNSDGRFTAERTASPYYPNVKVGRPIRVKATPVGDSEQVRFTGFIDEWPVAWDGTDSYASTRITASSRLARLGLNTSLRSVVEEEILQDAPSAYYTLGEPQGATSATDSSGKGQPALTPKGSGAPVTFGQATGPGTDSLTAASFAGGQYLGMKLNGGGAGDFRTVEFFLSTTASNVTIFGISGTTSGVPDTRNELRVSAAGKLQLVTTNAVGTSVTQGTSASTINDGATHHIVWVCNNAAEDGLYVDGAYTDVSIGVRATTVRLGAGYDGTRLTGTVAHLAAYDTDTTHLSVARIASHGAAGLTGFAGETAVTRFGRYARWARLPTTSVSASGSTTVGHVDSTGAQVADLLRRVEASEDGVVHDSRSDVLTLEPRAARYTAASAFTLSMASQQVGSDFQPKMDRSTLLNDVTVTNMAGVTGRVVDTASRDEYGLAAETIETLADNVDEPFELAAWRIGTYAQPRMRVPSLTVDILSLATGGTPTPATVMAADVGTLFTVTGQPGQAPASSAAYFVEGYTETIGGLSYSITFNVSPSYPHASTLMLDDATRGRLDQGNLLAH